MKHKPFTCKHQRLCHSVCPSWPLCRRACVQTASFVAGLPAESQQDTVQLIVHRAHRSTGRRVEGGCTHPGLESHSRRPLCLCPHSRFQQKGREIAGPVLLEVLQAKSQKGLLKTVCSPRSVEGRLGKNS